ncbi:MAG TPA: DUF4843 domain-containing protein [Chitinophagaceae bacterium]
MNRIIKILFLPLSALLILASCKEEELLKYDQPAMAYFYKDYFNVTAVNDSTVYSFAIRPDAQMTDTVKVPVRIMGPAAAVDRVVNILVIADSSTAVAATHYELLPVIVKANEFTTFMEVVVKRTADLKLGEVKLWVEIKESPDFKPGIPATTPTNPHAGGNLKYKIRLNDILTQPSNWNVLTSFFGVYSKVKYLFIIQATGLSVFSYGFSGAALSYADMNFLNDQCKVKLAQYESINGPLLDENGVRVTFP